MNSKIETVDSSNMDTVKLVIALLVAVAAMAALMNVFSGGGLQNCAVFAL